RPRTASDSGGSMGSTDATNVPRRGRISMYPSAARYSYACTTVLRDTPRSLASARLAGNWTPSRRRPSSIRLRICSKIWRCRFWRRLRSRHNGSCMSPSSSALFPQYCDNTGVSSTPAPETDHPMSETVLSLTQAQLAYGHHPLLDHADLALQAGE